MAKRNYYINFGNSPDHSLDYLRGIFEDARVTTLQRVESLTVEELHWQYKAGWNTIGALLSHIISLEHVFRIYFLENRELTEQENNRWEAGLEMGKFIPQLITMQPIDTYVAALAESRQMLLNSLANLTFDDFSERRKGYDPLTGCNLAWVLYHLAEDEVHHRGQISILRKLYQANK